MKKAKKNNFTFVKLPGVIRREILDYCFPSESADSMFDNFPMPVNILFVLSERLNFRRIHIGFDPNTYRVVDVPVAIKLLYGHFRDLRQRRIFQVWRNLSIRIAFEGDVQEELKSSTKRVTRSRKKKIDQISRGTDIMCLVPKSTLKLKLHTVMQLLDKQREGPPGVSRRIDAGEFKMYEILRIGSEGVKYLIDSLEIDIVGAPLLETMVFSSFPRLRRIRLKISNKKDAIDPKMSDFLKKVDRVDVKIALPSLLRRVGDEFLDEVRVLNDIDQWKTTSLTLHLALVKRVKFNLPQTLNYVLFEVAELTQRQVNMIKQLPRLSKLTLLFDKAHLNFGLFQDLLHHNDRLKSLAISYLSGMNELYDDIDLENSRLNHFRLNVSNSVEILVFKKILLACVGVTHVEVLPRIQGNYVEWEHYKYIPSAFYNHDALRRVSPLFCDATESNMSPYDVFISIESRLEGFAMFDALGLIPPGRLLSFLSVATALKRFYVYRKTCRLPEKLSILALLEKNDIEITIVNSHFTNDCLFYFWKNQYLRPEKTYGRLTIILPDQRFQCNHEHQRAFSESALGKVLDGLKKYALQMKTIVTLEPDQVNRITWFKREIEIPKSVLPVDISVSDNKKIEQECKKRWKLYDCQGSLKPKGVVDWSLYRRKREELDENRSKQMGMILQDHELEHYVDRMEYQERVLNSLEGLSCLTKEEKGCLAKSCYISNVGRNLVDKFEMGCIIYSIVLNGKSIDTLFIHQPIVQFPDGDRTHYISKVEFRNPDGDSEEGTSDPQMMFQLFNCTDKTKGGKMTYDVASPSTLIEKFWELTGKFVKKEELSHLVRFFYFASGMETKLVRRSIHDYFHGNFVQPPFWVFFMYNRTHQLEFKKEELEKINKMHFDHIMIQEGRLDEPEERTFGCCIQ